MYHKDSGCYFSFLSTPNSNAFPTLIIQLYSFSRNKIFRLGVVEKQLKQSQFLGSFGIPYRVQLRLYSRWGKSNLGGLRGKKITHTRLLLCRFLYSSISQEPMFPVYIPLQPAISQPPSGVPGLEFFCTIKTDKNLHTHRQVIAVSSKVGVALWMFCESLKGEG